MKYTLLELVQSVLRSIKGEAVNSIADTQESSDVADIIKECYFTIVSKVDLPETKTLLELEPSYDTAKPVLMTVPDDVYSVEWIKYNVETVEDSEDNWREINYLPLKNFLEYINNFDTTSSTVDAMTLTLNGDSVVFKYNNDTAPLYYTVIDDNQIVFDGFDTAVDEYLQKTKSQGYGIRMSTWQNTDDYTPKLDGTQFQLLLKEAKAMAWQEMKSIENVKAEREARKLTINAQAKRNRVNSKHMGYYYEYYPNYGRK